MSSDRRKQSYPYVPWFHGDFLRATVGWTLIERAAYWMLLCAQWEIGPLPNEPARLASIVGIDVAQMADIWPLISQKFAETTDGTLVNPRMEEHRTRVERYRKSLSEAGQKGMQSRWGSRKDGEDNTAPSPPEPPPGLDMTAWESWQQYRKLKPGSIAAAQRKLAAFGSQQAAVVEHSIASEYRGLYGPGEAPKRGSERRHELPDAFEVARRERKLVV